ncbi:hypothetical protein BS17DRAFT_818405 [Gyrodon lividus]|nr:hypothetical protein BS17DRAFT_818405 [Gyrodon lividus]
MSLIEDSLRHRTGKSLEVPSNRKHESFACNSLVCSSPSGSQPIQPSDVGQGTSSNTSGILAQWPELALVGEVPQVPSNAAPSAEIVATFQYPCATLPVTIIQPPQYNGSNHPIASYPLVVQPSPADVPYASFMFTPSLIFGFGGDPYEPYSAPQLPQLEAPMPQNHFSPPPSFRWHECRWLGGPRCNGWAPGKNREMAEHLRSWHHFVGHERDIVQCEWGNCTRTMQRMNIARHIVSTHIREAANCRFCGKRFSRLDVVSRHERTCTEPANASSSSNTGL